jgi:hypothetical protein
MTVFGKGSSKKGVLYLQVYFISAFKRRLKTKKEKKKNWNILTLQIQSATSLVMQTHLNESSQCKFELSGFLIVIRWI